MDIDVLKDILADGFLKVDARNWKLSIASLYITCKYNYMQQHFKQSWFFNNFSFLCVN